MSKWTGLVLVLFFGIVWAYNKSTTSTCLWHNNKCVDSCPDWLRERKSNCSQTYWPAQRTCENPELTLVGTVCGFSRCDCPDAMVLDTETGFCYDEDNCPTKHAMSYNYKLI
ncbi:uncharacterized protein [Choristoneura fumiferana]|uniref:uncharacterized protein n=1 Tax=Choristoneura fumiferana TaxID=7141 RepID=UPI003D15C992